MVRVTARDGMNAGARRRQPGPEDRPEPLIRRDECERADGCGVGRAVQDGFGLHHQASLTFTPAFPRWGWLIRTPAFPRWGWLIRRVVECGPQLVGRVAAPGPP